MLKNVQFFPRTQLKDPRGWFLKIITGLEPNLPTKTGEIYVTTTEQGAIRGNHYHLKTSEWLTVIMGTAEVMLSDINSGEQRAYTVSGNEPVTIFIPAGVGHAFKNPDNSGETLVFIMYADHHYDPEDTIPLNLI